MATSKFDKESLSYRLQRIPQSQARQLIIAANKWFKDKVNSNINRKIPTKTGLQRNNADRKVPKVEIGKMYHFVYDPKHKKRLPYYDTFPLIFVIKFYRDGFLGLNFHYVEPKFRAIILDNLLDLASNKKFNEKTKLRITYGIMESLSKFNYIRPCLKRYLFNHVRSEYIKIESHEWHIAIFLDTAKFKKEQQEYIWGDSEWSIKKSNRAKRKQR